MRILISIYLLIIPMMACSQFNLKGLEKTVTDKVQGKQPLSESEVVQGLKEALQVGSKNASGNASKTDGYYGNSLIKITAPINSSPVFESFTVPLTVKFFCAETGTANRKKQIMRIRNFLGIKFLKLLKRQIKKVFAG